jgi:acetyltransferase-like isoleucine patch superfamily enzyme
MNKSDQESKIHANEIYIGNNVEISSEVEIICDKISIGDGTVITGNSKIFCKDCAIGKNNFLADVLIEGSLNAGNTMIKIGNENLILQNTRLNCNSYLEIGDDVNIGQDVHIWTHASSMDVFKGYPFTKAPVKIGSHVWITAKTTILPGINIGSNVVIGNSTVVNKNIPDGCFAAGCPVKIIKENIFPKKLTDEEKETILKDAIVEYESLIEMKSFTANVLLNEDLKVEFIVEGKKTIFDCNNRTIEGNINVFSEDFRDFLRYRGIKFFIGVPSQSIKPLWYIKALKNDDF